MSQFLWWWQFWSNVPVLILIHKPFVMFSPLFFWGKGLIKQPNGHLIPCQGQLATLGNYNCLPSSTYCCNYQNSIWLQFCLPNVLIDIWFITISSRTDQCGNNITTVFGSVWFQDYAVFLESEKKKLFLLICRRDRFCHKRWNFIKYRYSANHN